MMVAAMTAAASINAVEGFRVAAKSYLKHIT
jgi:hypothetical protein